MSPAEIAAHLHEAAIHVEVLDLAALRDAQLAEAEPSDQRLAIVRDAELAVHHRDHDEIGRFVKNGLFGGYDHALEGFSHWRFHCRIQIADFRLLTSQS
jgi:hypothetical protein